VFDRPDQNTVAIFNSTRFIVLTRRETLFLVDYETEGCKNTDDEMINLRGTNDVVTVDGTARGCPLAGLTKV